MKVHSPHATTRRVIQQLEAGCVPGLVSRRDAPRHTREARALRAAYCSPLAACRRPGRGLRTYLLRRQEAVP